MWIFEGWPVIVGGPATFRAPEIAKDDNFTHGCLTHVGRIWAYFHAHG